MIDVVGKKWAFCVLTLLGRYGTIRFGPIQRCLSGVSPATLTTTLRSLEHAGLVRRVPAQGPRGPVRAYGLTPTGQNLYDRLLPLADWLSAARVPGRNGNARGRFGPPPSAPGPYEAPANSP